jgi:peptidoglycan/LPS O-acetylase OafA/YrhL
MIFLGHAGLLPRGLDRGYYLAVDLFFLLSGVVVAKAYERRLLAGLTPQSFARLRLIRFYPLYLLGTAIGIAFFVVSHYLGHPGNEMPFTNWIFFALFFVPFIGQAHTLYPFNPPAWSLFYELIINTTYGYSLKILTIRRLVFFSVIVAVCLFIYVLRTGDIGGWDQNQVFAAILRTSFSFSTGVLIWRCRDRLPRLRISGIILVAICIGLMMVSFSNQHTRLVQHLCTIVFVFPGIMAIAFKLPESEFSRAYVFLGACSYPLYCIHGPILSWAKALLDRLSAGPIWLWLLVPPLILAAYYLDVSVDRPVRAYLRERHESEPRSADLTI